jgi:hypothetical protein
MQAVSDVHDTPVRAAGVAAAGLGVARSFQLRPFQRSDNVWGADANDVEKTPTAMHALLDVHDTPPSMPNGDLGVRRTFQLRPFQRSASSLPFPAALVNPPRCPTAMQALLDVHDTACREPPPRGVRMRWTFQLRPFQRSANVLWT